jgi:hypothetical protein
MIKKLKTASKDIPIRRHSTEKLRELYPHLIGADEYLFGAYLSRERELVLNSDLEEGHQFEVLMHELGEMINSEFGLEMDHIQITAFCKSLADILKQNSTEIKKLF